MNLYLYIMRVKTYCLQSRNPTEDQDHKFFKEKNKHCSRQAGQC